MEALFDSGAEATLINLETYRCLTRPPPMMNYSTQLTTANGSKIKVMGQANIKFAIAGQSFNHPTVIVAGLRSPCIIGADFMEKNGVVIDMKRKKIVVNSEINEKNVCRVYTKKAVKLSPGMTKDILVKTDKRPLHDATHSTLCINETVRPLKIEDCIASWTRDGICIRAKNESLETISIDRNTELSSGYFLRRGDVLAIDSLQRTMPKKSKTPANNKFIKELELKLESVPTSYRKEYKALMEQYHDVFSSNPDDVGCCTELKQSIRLIDDNKVSATPPYRMPHHLLPIAHEYVKKLLRLDIIRPSTSPFSSPLMLVKKPGKPGDDRPIEEQYRIVHDYRRLNANTVLDKYPMRHIYDLLDEVTQGKVFTVIDLSQGFWNQLLTEESKPKTAFGVPGLGHFEYNRSAQGLCNSPSAFQRLLDFITKGIPGVYVYIDDLVLVSKTHDEHVKQLKTVLDRFRYYGFKCRLKKLQLATGEINYLGYNISREKGVRPGALKTAVIASWAPPTDTKGVKSFLGLCSFFRRTIPGFATIAAPLTELTRLDATWTKGALPTDALAAFNRLKLLLTSRPCLRPVDFNREFIVTVDSSLQGIGAILSQTGPDGIERPCAYASRVLQDAEKRYPPTKLEATGLLWSVKHFRPYLVGKHFTIRTDHQPLTALNRMTGFSLDRIYAELSEYLPFTIKYVPGKSMPADGLSRKEIAATSWVDLTTDQLYNMQQQDKYLKALVCSKKFNIQPTSSRLRSFVRSLRDEVVFQQGIVGIRRSGRFLPLCPHFLKSTLLQLAHDTRVSGHLGPEKTLKRIQSDWYWPDMVTEITNYCRSCETCLTCNHAASKRPSPLEPMPPATKFNERVHLDLLGPLPRSNGNQYVLVMSDAFSSWVELKGIMDKRAETVAKAFLQTWISSHSSPQRINSDQGSEFTAKVFQEISKTLGFRHAFSSVAHPRSAGQVEIVNKSALTYLRKFIELNHDWNDLLPLLKIALNSAPHSTKKYSPYHIVYGRRPNLATTLLNPTRTYSDEEIPQRLATLNRITQDVLKYQDEAFRRQKTEFDKRARERKFEVGDIVYIMRPHSGPLFQKFQPLFEGPYRVLEKRGHNNYKLAHETRRKVITVHIDRMKLAPMREQLFEENQPHYDTELASDEGQMFKDFEAALRNWQETKGIVMDDDPPGIQQGVDDGRRDNAELPPAQIPPRAATPPVAEAPPLQTPPRQLPPPPPPQDLPDLTLTPPSPPPPTLPFRQRTPPRPPKPLRSDGGEQHKDTARQNLPEGEPVATGGAAAAKKAAEKTGTVARSEQAKEKEKKKGLSPFQMGGRPRTGTYPTSRGSLAMPRLERGGRRGARGQSTTSPTTGRMATRQATADAGITLPEAHKVELPPTRAAPGTKIKRVVKKK